MLSFKYYYNLLKTHCSMFTRTVHVIRTRYRRLHPHAITHVITKMQRFSQKTIFYQFMHICNYPKLVSLGKDQLHKQAIKKYQITQFTTTNRQMHRCFSSTGTSMVHRVSTHNKYHNIIYSTSIQSNMHYKFILPKTKTIRKIGESIRSQNFST